MGQHVTDVRLVVAGDHNATVSSSPIILKPRRANAISSVPYREGSCLIMWLPWPSSNVHSNSSVKIKPPSPDQLKFDQAEEDVRHLKRAWGELAQLSLGTYSLLGLSAFAIFSVGWAAHTKWDSVHFRYFKRFKQQYDVPDLYIQKKRYLKGVVIE